jgi:hypothetical protein
MIQGNRAQTELPLLSELKLQAYSLKTLPHPDLYRQMLYNKIISPSKRTQQCLMQLCFYGSPTIIHTYVSLNGQRLEELRK